MSDVNVVVSTPCSTSTRARQLDALYDVPRQTEQTRQWTGRVPLDERPWSIGLIVGPSGCGKTTLARHLFGADVVQRGYEWNAACVLDDFAPELSIQIITNACAAVGFNTIPAWTRPFHVLSNGEQFRATIARALVEQQTRVVIDEFTSVVDRQVAQIVSHAVQKYVRTSSQQFVAVTCHYDVEAWLQPDWVLEPESMTFRWRELQRRPSIDAYITRVSYQTWQRFAPYHYLTANLNKAAQCFALCIQDQPVAFAGVLYRPHPRVADVYGVSRLVTLPDYQGLGLAFHLVDALGGAFRACGKRLHTYPAHPALVRGFHKSPHWKNVKDFGHFLVRSRGNNKTVGAGSFGGRPNATFMFCGAAWQSQTQAVAFLQIPSIA